MPGVEVRLHFHDMRRCFFHTTTDRAHRVRTETESRQNARLASHLSAAPWFGGAWMHSGSPLWNWLENIDALSSGHDWRLSTHQLVHHGTGSRLCLKGVTFKSRAKENLPSSPASHLGRSDWAWDWEVKIYRAVITTVQIWENWPFKMDC
jgi:hypothetical protein